MMSVLRSLFSWLLVVVTIPLAIFLAPQTPPLLLQLFLALFAVFAIGKILAKIVIGSHSKAQRDDFSAIIVGSGFSGLCVAQRLKSIGVTRITILEKGDGIGGVWRHNVYPGVACDIGSHLYSFSNFQNPWWSRAFCKGQEILAYAENYARYFGLTQHVKLKKTVKECQWDDVAKMWNVTTAEEGEEVFTANIVVQATGRLHVPNRPSIKNESLFRGRVFHSAEWDPSVEITDKRVAVVGTGASAVQIVPAVADQVQQLFVYQRKPAWVADRMDFPYHWTVKAVFKAIPLVNRVYRWLLFVQAELGHYLFFATNSIWVDLTRSLNTKMMKAKLNGDRELERKLIPEFQVGCKRSTPSEKYIQTFTKPNVHLIEEDIVEFTENGILDASGRETELDVVCLATGFDLMTNTKPFPTRVRGAQKSMQEQWGDCPTAYLGVTFPGMPNYFMMLGPNSGVMRGSILFMIECQADYITDCIRKLIKRSSERVSVDPSTSDKIDIFKLIKEKLLSSPDDVKLKRGEEDRRVKTMEVKEAVLKDFEKFMDLSTRDLVKGTSCPDWFAAKGSVFRWSQWPKDLISFWWWTRKCDEEDYVFK